MPSSSGGPQGRRQSEEDQRVGQTLVQGQDQVALRGVHGVEPSDLDPEPQDAGSRS